MDIINTSIFAKQLLLKKYAKRVTTARVVSFVLVGMAYIGFTLVFINMRDIQGYSQVFFWIPMAFTTVMLFLVIASYFKPFISLTILSALCAIGVLMTAFSFLGTFMSLHEIPNLMSALIRVAGQSLVTYLIIRGTINARKYEKLKVQLNRPNDLL